MNAKEKALAVTFLEEMSERYSNHGCNDWEFPKDWSEEERRAFVKAYCDWNGDPEEYDPKYLVLPDFAVIGYLAALLAEEKR